MRGFVDIHSHFLYGVDDGARTKEDMEAMLDAAHANGIAVLYATPHITPGIKSFDMELCRLHLEEAKAYCAARNYSMELRLGGELLYTPMFERYAMEHELPTLGDSEQILIEFLPDVSFSELEAAVDLSERLGYLPVLAHIERYKCMMRFTNAWKLKKKYNVCYQVNASTVLQRRGIYSDWMIHRWFSDRLIDYVACDAHNCRKRTYRMRTAFTALKQRYGKRYASYLTCAKVSEEEEE